MVSYNTREMTLACLGTVAASDVFSELEVIVVDNASTDGSPDAIAEAAPWAQLIRSERNLGFAGANNLAAERATGRRLLLLNPDTLVPEPAIGRLLRFADDHPGCRLWGGRTTFADGRANPSSCWRMPTPWSVFCSATGLASIFRGSRRFNPESLGVLPEHGDLPADIISGCWLLIDTELWRELRGFDPAFFMYGEDADLCLRAARLGATPRVCCEAQIVHFGGQSERVLADKLVRLYTARRLLYARFWAAHWQWWADLGPKLNVLRRIGAARIARLLGRRGKRSEPSVFADVWRRRTQWTTPGIETQPQQQQGAAA